jgi:GNAT superfamily N-acetyltransferase
MEIRIVKVSPKNKKIKLFAKREWKAFNKEVGYSYKEDKYKFAAFEGRTLVGFASLEITGGVMYLAQLLVSKTIRGRGVGRLLIERAERFAREKRCHRIYLKTSERHIDALRLYKREGYRKIAELKNHTFHLTWYLLAKELA